MGTLISLSFKWPRADHSSYLMGIYLEASSTALCGELWDSISALQHQNWKTGYLKPQSAPVCWEVRCSDTSVQGGCVERSSGKPRASEAGKAAGDPGLRLGAFELCKLHRESLSPGPQARILNQTSSSHCPRPPVGVVPQVGCAGQMDKLPLSVHTACLLV